MLSDFRDVANGVAAGLANPDAARVAATFDSSPGIAARLAAGSEALSLGLLSFRTLPTEAYEADVSFLLSEDAPDALLLGLANPESFGDGLISLMLSVSVGGETQIDAVFTEIDEALLFFDDRIFGLDTSVGRDVRIEILASAAGSDAFQFEFGLLTIPEPGTAVLLFVGLVALRVLRPRTRSR
jgi:hypothetical protein